MAIITPTLNFNGHCEEALLLYQEAFRGRIGCLYRYRDADPKDRDLSKLTAQQLNYVYHAELLVGDQRIMMCDNIDVPFLTSYACFITVTFDTDEQVRHAYEVLYQDCKEIIYPLERTTYSSCQTVLVDKFGIRWGIMTETV